MNKYKKNIKNQNQIELNWKFNHEPQITESIINSLVIGENKRVYIPFSKLKEINVESGGSPFTYTYHYDTCDRWYVDKSSKGSCYLGENEDDYTFENLFDFVLQNMNWKNIGYDIESNCIKKWRSTFSPKFTDHELLLVDWEWVLYQIDNLTKSDVDIIFSQDDLSTLSSINY